MKKSILSVFAIASSLMVHAAAYTGKVYIDSNRNGICDKGEKTVQGVMVSDGLNVVKTSSDGCFSLPGHEKERFLFITVPSGYKTANYYQAIKQGRTEYDFGMQTYQPHIEKGGAHSFVHISDTEIRSSAGEGSWVSDVRTYAANEKAAFIIHTGDICYESGLTSHKPMMNTDNMDIPMYYCIGNHDLVRGKYGEEFFESIYGPVYYSFDAGNMHYIVTPMWDGDAHPSYSKSDVFRWLKNDLAQIPSGKPIIIFNHDYWTQGDRHLFNFSADETLDLDACHLKAWIYGHVHMNHITKHGEVLAICTSTPARGGIDHAASAFRTIRIDSDTNVHSELRYTYIDKQVEIASVQNGQIPLLPSGELPISVNAYSTVSPVVKVVYDCLLENKTVVKQRSMAQQTDFNWYDNIQLPNHCKGRVVTIEASAYFANGEVAKVQRFFTCPSQRVEGKLSGNWTNLLGNPQHVGIAPDTLSLPLALSWVKNLGSNIYMTSPLVYNNNVYMASIDENATGKAVVMAIDALTGEIKWKFQTRASVKNSIAATQGLIFAQDVYGYLYAVDAVTGRLAWEKKLAIELMPGLNKGLIATEDRVFAGSGEGLCALEAMTGKELWRNSEWKRREGTTATLALSPKEDVLIGGVQWSAMYANDAHTGKMLWSEDEKSIRHRASSPAMYDGVCYFLSHSSLFMLSEKTGKIMLEKKLPYSVDVTSTPLLTKSEIIFGTASDGIVALDNKTLEEKWKFRTGEALIYTSPYVAPFSAQIECSPLLSGDMVLIGASDGVFYALDRTKGTLLWKHATGAPIMSSMAVSGDMLFGADYSGNVYGFKSK